MSSRIGPACQSRGLIEEESDELKWRVTPGAPVRGRRYKLLGTADVSLIRSPKAVANYCAKYVAKGGSVDLFGLTNATG